MFEVNELSRKLDSPITQPTSSVTHTRIPSVHEQTTKTGYARAVPVGRSVECDVPAVPKLVSPELRKRPIMSSFSVELEPVHVWNGAGR